MLPDVSMLWPVAATPLRDLQETKKGGAYELASSFREVLAEQLKALNESQQQADALTLKYWAGEVRDLHEVVLALEQANLSLQLAVQVRNKLLEAYQEISRLQL